MKPQKTRAIRNLHGLVWIHSCKLFPEIHHPKANTWGGHQESSWTFLNPRTPDSSSNRQCPGSPLPSIYCWIWTINPDGNIIHLLIGASDQDASWTSWWLSTNRGQFWIAFVESFHLTYHTLYLPRSSSTKFHLCTLKFRGFHLNLRSPGAGFKPYRIMLWTGEIFPKI